MIAIRKPNEIKELRAANRIVGKTTDLTRKLLFTMFKESSSFLAFPQYGAGG